MSSRHAQSPRGHALHDPMMHLELMVPCSSVRTVQGTGPRRGGNKDAIPQITGSLVGKRDRGEDEGGAVGCPSGDKAPPARVSD